MTLLRVWHGLIYLGDGAVLLPGAALLFAWLIAARATRRTGWWWLLAVLLVAGLTALSKVLYMVSGWHPAGWNFIGMSGHAAFSFLVWPVAAALVTSRCRTALRVVAIALGGCLALAISVSSWVLGDHSLAEIVLGALWGTVVAAALLAIIWRHAVQAPVLRKWAAVGGLLMLLVLVVYRHQFPSTRVLSGIAMQLSGRTTVYTRDDLGPRAALANTAADAQHANSKVMRRSAPR